MERAIHRLNAHVSPTLRDPRIDSIAKPRVGLSFCVLPKPLEVDDARIVSAAWLELNVAGLSVASKDSTHRRATDAEHLRRRVVRRG